MTQFELDLPLRQALFTDHQVERSADQIGIVEFNAGPLVAIVLTAIAAVALQAAYGNVHVDKGLLVGVPAVGGVVAGTWLQQRVPGAVVRLLFAIFLVATAILLVVRA